jgi:dTDP-4-dehydrorhamnose reductase
MRLLIGGDSEIGAATWRYMTRRGHTVRATTRRPDRVCGDRPLLDLSHLDHFDPPEQTRAAGIFAAIARPSDCHADPIGSARINVVQTLALVERLVARGIYVVFMSSNQVYDGETVCMPADAPTAPVSEYGHQKALAEAGLRRMMAHGHPVAILRVSKVLSPDITLLRDWVEALSAHRPITAFHDMTMAPVPIDLVAAAISAMMEDRSTGVFQLTGPRDVSYVQAGCRIAELIGADSGLVRPVSARSAGMPRGTTPRHTTLDSSLLRERHGVTVPDAWEAIAPLVPRARLIRS